MSELETRGTDRTAATTTAALADEIATLAASLDAATHRLLTCIRAFDESEGWGLAGALSCARWLSWRIGLDPGAAREKVRVARALGELPRIDDALRRGAVSYSKVRAMTRVATQANEQTLLDMAIHATGAELERICRGARQVVRAREREEGLGSGGTEIAARRGVRVRSTADGMVCIEAVLERDEAALVLKSLQLGAHDLRGVAPLRGTIAAETSTDGAEAPAPQRPTHADALVAVAESYLAHGAAAGTGGDRTQILVHLAQDALGGDGDLAATLEDGRRVSAETFRRLACDSGLVPVAVDAEGRPLDVGRRTRSIPPAIRRALQVRDRHCQFPGCTNSLYVHAHHVEHWLHGGETSVENLALLCAAHHHAVHEGGWTVERDAEGELCFRAPDGDAVPRVWAREEVEDASLGVWTRDLGITPATNECKGSFGGFDLGWAVEAVVGRSGAQGPRDPRGQADGADHVVDRWT